MSLAQTRGIVARGVNRKATGLRQTRLRNLLLSAEQRRCGLKENQRKQTAIHAETHVGIILVIGAKLFELLLKLNSVWF